MTEQDKAKERRENETDDRGRLDELRQRIADLEVSKAALQEAEAQLQRRQQEMALLSLITTRMASAVDLSEGLGSVCSELARFLNVSQASFAILNAERDAAEVMAEHRHPDSPSAMGVTIPVTGNPTMTYILENQSPLAIADAQTNPLLAPIHDVMRRRKVQSILVVPMVVEGEVIGALAFDAFQRHAFSHADIELVQNVANQAGQLLMRNHAEEALQKNEQILTSFLKSASDSLYLLDSDLNFLEINEKGLEIIGKRREEVIGRNITDIVPDVKQSGRYEKHIEVIRTGQPFVIEDHVPHPVFGDLHFVLKSFKVGDGLGVIASDITERVRAEEALRRERDRAQRYLNVAGVIMLVLDEKGEVTLINRKGCQVLGFEEEALIGQNWFETCLPPRVRKEVKAVFRQLMAGEIEPVEYFENPVLKSSGEERIIAWHNIVLTDEAGTITGTLSSGEDITERKRVDQLLRALNQAALEMERALTTDEIFIAVSQQLKTVGLSCMVFPVDEGKRRLLTKYMSYESKALEAVEKLVGIRHEDFSIAMDAIAVYREAARKKRTIFERDAVEVLRQVLPDPAKRFAGQIAGILRVPAFIVAPLIIGDKVVALLSVQSDDLSEADVPAITAFAHQMAAAWRKAELYQQAQQEIAERKRAEEERTCLLAQVQEQAEQTRQIVDTVPEGVVLLDGVGRVVLANPVGEENLVSLADAKVGDTLSRLGDHTLEELLVSPPTGLWHEVATDGPAPRVCEVIARPVEAEPAPSGWVLVIRDVTQEREIERRLQQQERLAAVGQLAAGIAHDFNNIMAVILLYARMALNTIPDLSAKNRNRLTTITQQARHASDLIQQILDFSRRAVIERQPLNLVPFLKEQVRLLERTLPENVRVHLRAVERAGEYIVNADPTRIQQIVMNLALNARDAMLPKGGGDLHIGLERMYIQGGEVATLPEMGAGEWVRVTMSDSGVGIAPDVLPRVFDPFFTTKEPGQGSGLGLAQVYGIVKQHEGEIDVESEMGQGTTFTIYLPALMVQRPEVVREEEELPQGAGEKILVVEDDARTREALVDTLEALNYRALGVANGREALEVLGRGSHEIRLVLSDAVMPEMGGIALFHNVRRDYPEVGVVLLTGHPLEKELEGLRAQGLRAWLLKPVDLQELAQLLVQALKG